MEKSKKYTGNQRASLESFLDFSRALAAFMVLLGHLRHPLFVVYSEVAKPSIFWKVFYFFTGCGTEAVIVFFVLSGYLIGGKNLKRAKHGQFDFVDYSIHRISRLYVVLVPALILGYTFDLVGSTYLQSAGLYDHGQYTMRVHIIPDYIPIDHLDFSIFLGNLFMLQRFYVTTLGSNTPLWSLSYEFWFYVFFGLAMVGMSVYRQAFIRLICFVVLAIGSYLVLGKLFLFYLVLWLIGLLAAIWNPGFARYPYLLYLLFLIVLVITRLDILPSYLLDNLLIAMTFGAILISMKINYVGVLAKKKKITRLMASFSYSLYLLHYPLMLFLVSLWVEVFKVQGFGNAYQPDSKLLAIFFVLMLTILIFSYYFATLTEFHTANCVSLLKKQWNKFF